MTNCPEEFLWHSVNWFWEAYSWALRLLTLAVSVDTCCWEACNWDLKFWFCSLKALTCWTCWVSWLIVWSLAAQLFKSFCWLVIWTLKVERVWLAAASSFLTYWQAWTLLFNSLTYWVRAVFCEETVTSLLLSCDFSSSSLLILGCCWVSSLIWAASPSFLCLQFSKLVLKVVISTLKSAFCFEEDCCATADCCWQFWSCCLSWSLSVATVLNDYNWIVRAFNYWFLSPDSLSCVSRVVILLFNWGMVLTWITKLTFCSLVFYNSALDVVRFDKQLSLSCWILWVTESCC